MDEDEKNIGGGVKIWFYQMEFIKVKFPPR